MSRLDALPLDAVQSLPAELMPVLRAEAGARWRVIDLRAHTQRESRVQEMGAALGADADFGSNLDALYDLLTDLPSGQVLWLEGYASGPEDALLLEVLRDATRQQAEAGRSLRVLY